MDQFTKANEKMLKDMEKEHKFGRMEVNILANGYKLN